MSRQEATNVFNDGLVMDLNPLTTPDNVLTDCLNGTFITYNGNEFVLQNDQGNFKLKNCRLKPNHIPIGIREYAGILYILSHNPLTSETEVGSYPSPRRIFDTNDRDHQVVFEPIIPQLPEGEVLIDTYENLSKKARLRMYAQSDNLQNFKLNPGDEFRLGVDETTHFPYQALQFSVLSEDKELFYIDIPSEYKVPVDEVSASDWHKVFWEVPGWLTGKYELANLNQFYLNIKNIELPEFSEDEDFKFSLHLNSQLEIADELFLKKESLSEDLRVEYTFWIKNSVTNKVYTQDGVLVPSEYIVDGTNVRFVDNDGTLINGASFNGHLSEPLKELNYTSLYKSYYNNYLGTEGMPFIGRNKDELVYVSAVPVLITKNVKVYYEQFRTNLEINLGTISSATEIRIADTLFTHTVDDAHEDAPYGSVTINFNVNGPFANTSQLELFIDIYDLRYEQMWAKDPIHTFKVEDLNVFGQNIVEIPFTVGAGLIGTEGFKAEDIYIITFRFVGDGQDLIHVNKLLIASKTLNEFYGIKTEFNSQLSANDWIYNLKEYTSPLGKFFNYTNFTPIGEPILVRPDPDPDDLKSWNIPLHQTFPSSFIYKILLKGEVGYDTDYSFNTLQGTLWQDLNPDVGLTINKVNYGPVSNKIEVTYELHLNCTVNSTGAVEILPEFRRVYLNEKSQSVGVKWGKGRMNHSFVFSGDAYTTGADKYISTTLFPRLEREEPLNIPNSQPFIINVPQSQMEVKYPSINWIGGKRTAEGANVINQFVKQSMNNMGLSICTVACSSGDSARWHINGASNNQATPSNGKFVLTMDSAASPTAPLGILVGSAVFQNGGEDLWRSIDYFNSHVFTVGNWASSTDGVNIIIAENPMEKIISPTNYDSVQFNSSMNTPVYNAFSIEGTLQKLITDGTFIQRIAAIKEKLNSKINSVWFSTDSLVFNARLNWPAILNSNKSIGTVPYTYPLQENNKVATIVEEINSDIIRYILQSKKDKKDAEDNFITSNGVFHDIREEGDKKKAFDDFIGRLKRVSDGVVKVQIPQGEKAYNLRIATDHAFTYTHVFYESLVFPEYN